MKKHLVPIICFCCACMLLLSSCGVLEVRTVSTNNENKQQQQTQTPDAPKTEFYIDGDLPEIGEYTGNKWYDRFYDEPTYTFIPSDEYGTIIPYVGKVKAYSTSDYPDDSAMYTYFSGFCTTDGKIVMDASVKVEYIYTYTTNDGFTYYEFNYSAEQDEASMYDYMPTESFIVPSSGKWCIRLTPGSWVRFAGDGFIAVAMCPELEQNEGYYYPVPNSIVLYDYDGNKISELNNVVSYSEFSQGYSAVSFDRDVSEIYGNAAETAENVEAVEETAENAEAAEETAESTEAAEETTEAIEDTAESAELLPVEHSDEMTADSTPPVIGDSSAENDIIDYTSLYYYVDSNLNIVSGPYSSADTFNCYGIANVADFDGNHYMIDTNFERINDKNYKMLLKTGDYDDPDGLKYFIANKSGTSYRYDSVSDCDIYKGDGTFLGEVSFYGYASWFFPDNGQLVYSTGYTDTNGNFVYDFKKLDGSGIYNTEYDVSPNSITNNDNYFMYTDHQNDKTLIMDVNGNTVCYIEDYYSSDDVKEDGTVFIYSTGDIEWDYDERTDTSVVEDNIVKHVYSTETNGDIFTVEGSGYGMFTGKDNRYVVFTKDDYTTMSGIGNQSLYDTLNGELLFEDCQRIACECIGGEYYFTVCKGDFSTLYDGDFNVVLQCLND